MLLKKEGLTFTMSELLRFVAGRDAFQLIKRQGFYPNSVGTVISAAGGPKWFSIFGLTRYVLQDLLSQSKKIVHLVGSSVGAWQMAAGACRNPGVSMDRLRRAYSHYRYSDMPSPGEISLACRWIINHMINGQEETIISNSIRPLHIITSRGKGVLSSARKELLYPGFAITAFGNAFSRRNLNLAVRRTIFTSSEDTFFTPEMDCLGTDFVRLSSLNLLDALQGSGSIPIMMNGVRNIQGAASGLFWDGGITDYHISMPFNLTDGLVLQPHFSPFVLPGWFDKKLPWNRSANLEYMARVLLVYPSDKFVRSLPKRRISELKDFERFGAEQEARMAYWDEICRRSIDLATEFHEIVEKGTLPDKIQPYK